MYINNFLIYLFLLCLFFSPFLFSNDFNMTIEPDGSNLPLGKGKIEVGKIIFKNNCSKCHGFYGEGLTAPELAGGTMLNDENISLTIGNFWPYAPKIFDYIRRTKRSEEGRRFSDNEVYGITAYLLKLNKLYFDDEIDKNSLSRIIMPNRNGFINNYLLR